MPKAHPTTFKGGETAWDPRLCFPAGQRDCKESGTGVLHPGGPALYSSTDISPPKLQLLVSVGQFDQRARVVVSRPIVRLAVKGVLPALIDLRRHLFQRELFDIAGLTGPAAGPPAVA
jgi:hypothetical protein